MKDTKYLFCQFCKEGLTIKWEDKKVEKAFRNYHTHKGKGVKK